MQACVAAFGFGKHPAAAGVRVKQPKKGPDTFSLTLFFFRWTTTNLRNRYLRCPLFSLFSRDLPTLERSYEPRL